MEFRKIHKGVKEGIVQTIIQHSMVLSHKFQEDVINIHARGLRVILDSIDSIYLSLEVNQSMKKFSIFVYHIQPLVYCFKCDCL